MKTIIYINGGDYAGEFDNVDLEYWKQMGLGMFQKYLYKGYRYYDGKKDIVTVYDTKRWDAGEIARRKANGFLGIREYVLPEPKR